MSENIDFNNKLSSDIQKEFSEIKKLLENTDTNDFNEVSLIRILSQTKQFKFMIQKLKH